MSNDKVIYEHHWPGTEKYYIGIGSVGRPRDFSQRSEYHKRLTAKYGRPVITIMAEGLSWEEACSREIATIGFYRAAGIDLVNLTDGGEGVVGLAPEPLARRSASVRKTYSNPEVRARLSEARQKVCKDPVVIKNYSEASRLKWSNDEYRAKVVESMRERCLDPELRAKRSASNYVMWGRKEHRENISKKMSGENNPMFDSTIRIYESVTTGETFTGSAYSFASHIGTNSGHAGKLHRGNSKTVLGWRYVGLADLPIAA